MRASNRYAAPADRIRIITRAGDDLPSAIVRKINAGEGSQILSRPEEASSPWLRIRLANLGIMYEAAHAVSHILDIDELSNRILELLFESVEADRGCVLLRKSAEAPAASAVRGSVAGGVGATTRLH